MLLIIGASVRLAMQSAARAGIAARGLDFFGDLDANPPGYQTLGLTQDLQQTPSVANLLLAAREIPCEGLVYLSGPENQPQALQYWQERGLLLGNRPDSLALVRGPRWLRQTLARAGARMPDCYEAARFAGGDGRRYLLKPLHRGGGHGIRYLPSQPAALAQALPAQADPYLIQEYQPGLSCSFSFLADGKQALLAATSSQFCCGPPQRPFLYGGNILPLPPRLLQGPNGLAARMQQIAQVLTEAAGLVGFNTIDLQLNARGAWVLEVNPRWSASLELLEQQLDTPLLPYHLAACRGELRQLPPPKQAGYLGKAIVYARRDLPAIRYPANGGWQALYEAGLRDLPQPGSSIPAGQPLCTVLTRADTSHHCRQALAARSQWAHQLFEKGESQWPV